MKLIMTALLISVSTAQGAEFESPEDKRKVHTLYVHPCSLIASTAEGDLLLRLTYEYHYMKHQSGILGGNYGYSDIEELDMESNGLPIRVGNRTYLSKPGSGIYLQALLGVGYSRISGFGRLGLGYRF